MLIAVENANMERVSNPRGRVWKSKDAMQWLIITCIIRNVDNFPSCLVNRDNKLNNKIILETFFAFKPLLNKFPQIKLPIQIIPNNYNNNHF